MSRPLRAFTAVVVIVGAGVAVADLAPAPHRAQRLSSQARSLQVSSATLVCPSVGHDRSTGWTMVSAASTPTAGSQTGSVTVEPLPATGNGAATLLDRSGSGATRDMSAAKDRGGIVVARGGPAAGLAAAQMTRTRTGPERGIASTRCDAAQREWWFAGPTGGLGTYGEVVLTNPEDAVALVDLELWGHDGPLVVPRAEGITVPALDRVSIPLSQLVPDVPNAVIHVVARTGRVAAAVSDRRWTGSRPDGVDWVPATLAPARDVVVPGMVSGVPTRKLVLGVPGADDATVSVRVVGRSGAFVPTALAKLAVPAGTVSTVDLSSILAAEDVALEVVSDVPVVAAGLLRERDRDTGFADIAWTAAVPPLDGPAVVAQTRVHSGNDTRLLLSAPKTAATVVISALGPAPRHDLTVEIPAGRTVSVDAAKVLPADVRSGAVAITPAPGSGPLYAARLVYEHGAHGPLFTVQPLRSPLRTASVPPVVADPGTATADR